jgi:hypothetical protein
MFSDMGRNFRMQDITIRGAVLELSIKVVRSSPGQLREQAAEQGRHPPQFALMRNR